jgi:copper chaperone CopZ
MGATLLISLPLYVCATASVPIAAALVASGMPVGAALVFLMAGPATNVATIGAIYRALGKKALGIYLATIIIGSIGFGLAFEFVIDTTAVAPMQHHDHTTWWALASAIVLLGLLARFALEDLMSFLKRNQESTARADSTDNEISIDVEGMTCNGCVSRLHKVLTREEGVTDAEVTLEPGHATVHGNVSEARVRELIEQAGFDPA